MGFNQFWSINHSKQSFTVSISGQTTAMSLSEVCISSKGVFWYVNKMVIWLRHQEIYLFLSCSIKVILPIFHGICCSVHCTYHHTKWQPGMYTIGIKLSIFLKILIQIFSQTESHKLISFLENKKVFWPFHHKHLFIKYTNSMPL